MTVRDLKLAVAINEETADIASVNIYFNILFKTLFVKYYLNMIIYKNVDIIIVYNVKNNLLEIEKSFIDRISYITKSNDILNVVAIIEYKMISEYKLPDDIGTMPFTTLRKKYAEIL